MTADPCSQRPDVDHSAALSVAAEVRSRGRVTCKVCLNRPALWRDDTCRPCQDDELARLTAAETAAEEFAARQAADYDARREPPPDAPADEPFVISEVDDSPPAEPTISAARIRAAVARIVRHHACAAYRVAFVFGRDSVVTEALCARVAALRTAIGAAARIYHAARLHQLTVWLGAAAETIEGEDDHAAALACDLSTIVAETELICSLTDHAGAAEEASEDPDADVDEAVIDDPAAVMPPAA